MEFKDLINIRRSYRSLMHFDVTREFINEIGRYVSLAPSCFNKQPWRFVFVYDHAKLSEIHSALPDGNKWATSAPLIIAVFSKKELDCVVKDRDYFLFDTGMAVAYLILSITDMGLVAHPIAGYDEDKVKIALNIPQDMKVIALVVVGRHADKISPFLTEKQAEIEKNRPERFALEKFIFHNVYFESEGG